MKKLVKSLVCLFILCGCSNDAQESFEPKTYTYVDTRQDTVKQCNMISLDSEVETIDDFKKHSDLIVVGTIKEIQKTEIKNDRFRTPFEIDSQEVIKGDVKERIYIDGGRMTLEDYEPQMIKDYLNKDAFEVLKSMYPIKSSYIAIIPVNYAELEDGKTYLFFLKDEMIVNGGYGVFEKIDENTYQNVITEEKIQLDQVK